MAKLLRKLLPPKVMWVNSMFALGIKKNGRYYLQITQVGKDGVFKRYNFLVEHLVDENFEITDQTLEQEKEFFTIGLS